MWRKIFSPVAISLTLTLTLPAAPSGAYERSGRTHLLTGAHPDAIIPELELLPSDMSTAITPSGRFVAFSSTYSDLVDRDVNLVGDVFVRDTITGSTSMVSVSSDGLQGVSPPEQFIGSVNPSISRSGRYVAFESDAINLVRDDTNLLTDVFVHDRMLRTTERVSVSSRSNEANGISINASISNDGRFVAFESDADNLVEGDTNGVNDIFVHDRTKGTTVRVSVDSNGAQAESKCSPVPIVGEVVGSLLPSLCAGGSYYPSISGNGRYVVFASPAANLVEQDLNDQQDIFMHDLQNGRTRRVSVASDGSETGPRGASSLYMMNRAISSDGRYVFFSSLASNLVPNDPWGDATLPDDDAYVHDIKTGRTERINVTSSGEEAAWSRSTTHLCTGSGAAPGAISSGGRYVVFTSIATNLLPRSERSGSDVGVGCNDAQVFIFDREAGTVGLVSVDDHGDRAEPCDPQLGPTADFPSVSGNGRHVAFWSCSESLSSDDNHYDDLFLRDRGQDLGVGGFSPPNKKTPPLDGPLICILDICIPPQAAVSFGDDGKKAPATFTERGADLIGGSIAYRPALGDLYVTLELESMPRTPLLATATAGILYGMSFELDGRSYEIRAASAGPGLRGETTAVFGLFSCTMGGLACPKVGDISGGFGSTGERINFSVPLDYVGVESYSVVSKVHAFTALGSHMTGATRILDELRIR